MRKVYSATTQPAQPSDQKTTARELANELSSSAASLKQAAGKLREEIGNIGTAKNEIEEERDSAILTFVKTTLPDLQSDQFDVLSDLAQQTSAVGGQSLSFVRQKMIQTRDAALQEVNAAIDHTVDADSFLQMLDEAKQKLTDANAAVKKLTPALQVAQTALATWTNSVEYSFIALSDDVAKNGQPAINADTRAYYCPTNLFTAAKWSVQRGAHYNKVRDALIEYGQDENGKDLFAEMAGYRNKTKDLEEKVATTETAYTAARQEQVRASAALDKFAGASGKVVTDAQILEDLQGKVVKYLATPEFAKAVSDHYAEDFPKSVPLMTAKLTVLDKLEDGASEKLRTLDANVLELNKHYAEISRLRAHTELPIDLDKVRSQNAARRAEYDNYTTATRDSWSRTRTYRDVVYVDNSPSMLEWYIIANMMNSNNHGAFSPCATSSYTADMLRLDREQARTCGVPDSAFNVSPDIVREMKDLGISNYDRTGSFTFDIPTATAAGADNDNFSFTVDREISDAVANVPAETVRETPVSSRGDFSFNAERRETQEPAERPSQRSSDNNFGFPATEPRPSLPSSGC